MGPGLEVKEAEIILYKGISKNKPSEIQVLLAETGLAPWSLPDIGSFKKEGIGDTSVHGLWK